jgi:predicted acetyltransferase
MARWFADDSSHPLVILQNNRPVGFALVSRPPVNRRAELDFRLAEFFVTADVRRLGVGASAATLIFSRFAGRWEIIEFLRNAGAVAFWRTVIGKYTSGRYRESVANGEVRHVFQSPKA